jgi:hypothetical protein
MARKAAKRKDVKKTVTTGEAARLLDVSQHCTIAMFDRGELRGFKVPRTSNTPGPQFRRILVESVVAKAKEWGLTIPPAQWEAVIGGSPEDVQPAPQPKEEERPDGVTDAVSTAPGGDTRLGAGERALAEGGAVLPQTDECRG